MDFDGMMAGYSQFFGTKEQPNKPACTAVQVVLPAGVRGRFARNRPNRSASKVAAGPAARVAVGASGHIPRRRKYVVLVARRIHPREVEGDQGKSSQELSEALLSCRWKTAE
jgi:hypothetical protein